MAMADHTVFSEEEIPYYRALLSWDPDDSSNDDNNFINNNQTPDSQIHDNHDHEPEEIAREQVCTPEPPVGQFMVLVLGDKGCGKTAILERFCNNTFSPPETHPHPHPHPRRTPPPSKVLETERGYHHRMALDAQPYILNALELPLWHLWSRAHISQAVQITEAALLVYDVTSRASFDFVVGVYALLEQLLLLTPGSGNGNGGDRVYGLVLVGTHADDASSSSSAINNSSNNSSSSHANPELPLLPSDKEREVTWAEGYRLAQSFPSSAGAGIGIGSNNNASGCAFFETSAKTGLNIDLLFPQLGKECLKARWLNHQRRQAASGARRHCSYQQEQEEERERQERYERQQQRIGRWKSWTRPWLKRKHGRDRKAGAPY